MNPSSGRRTMLLALGGIVGLALGVPALVGRRRDELADREALLSAQGPGQWVVIGSFDERWPAEIVSTIDGLGDVYFEHRGTPRSYEHFDGYLLRVVHLVDHDEQSVTVVLRSVPPGTDEPPGRSLEREDVEQGVRR